MSRIKGFNKSEVLRFFTNIEEVMPSYKFSLWEFTTWMGLVWGLYKNLAAFGH
jgi:hypothetical protein